VAQVVHQFRRLAMDADRNRNSADRAYRGLFADQIPDAACCVLSASGHILSCNAGVNRLYGYSVRDITGRHFSAFFTEEDGAASRPGHILDAAAREGAFQGEASMVRRDGRHFHATVTLSALNDEEGALQGFVALVRDVTDISERTHQDEKSPQSDEGFRLLYEHAPVAILQFDRNGYVTSANRKFAELSGYSPEEAIGLRLADTSLPEDTDAGQQLVDALASGEIASIQRERRLLRKDGSTRWMRATAQFKRDSSGRLQWGTAVLEDIHQRKEAEHMLRQSEEHFRLLFENAPIGIAQVDHEGRLTSANARFAEITGYSSEEARGFTHVEITLPEELPAVSQDVAKLFSTDADLIQYEKRLLRKDRSTRWVRVTGRAIRETPGRVQWGIVLYEDIAERKRGKDALQQSEEKFRATFEHAPLGIAECALDGSFIDVNSKLAELLGYTKRELTGLTFADVTHPGDMEQTLVNLQKLTAGESASYVMEKRYVRKDGSLLWVNVRKSLASVFGTPPYLIVTVEDITKRRLAEEDLKTAMKLSYHQANHDRLTGLANRASFADRLKEALAYAKRDGHLVALHMLDLDRFKSINDTLGHRVGDLFPRDVAKRIRSHVRATDVAARLGGDEFVVIQTHLASPSAAGVVAGKLVDDLKRTYILEDQEVQNGASIGIALYPDDAEDPDDLMKHADLALYDAKRRGRFNYQFYRKELGAAALESQLLERELARALREDELFLNYQPQFDLKSGAIAGIEVLLRWQHPARGRLTAADFLADAEQARLMLQIDQWVFRTACRQYKGWIESGCSVPLTLNLSQMQLRDPRLPETLQRVCDETGVPASVLQLEMSEGVLWDPKFPKGVLARMKEGGLRLAIHDFGSGMTALATLDRFPLDAVKPGRELVRALPSRQRAATILSAIVGLAHDRNIAVCADGVETASELTSVMEQGCDAAQGYLLSVPLDSNEMHRLIAGEQAH
jgi:diguanylate cyclase (GGDEF)-like protein/PAS domain S-box-containing protein